MLGEVCLSYVKKSKMLNIILGTSKTKYWTHYQKYEKSLKYHEELFFRKSINCNNGFHLNRS